MARRRFSEVQVIETLVIQAFLKGWESPRCYRCGEPFKISDKIEREHITEIALGGQDVPYNCAYSHRECHARITNGTKATTAGSSKQRIAKVKRIRGETCTRKGPPIKSRGFDKRFTKRMSGTIERRNT